MEKKMNIEFLENLLNQISVSGSEENGQRVLREYMEQYADEIRTDEIGDVICVLNPESPVRIMLSAHADEIGLVVTRITEEGRIQAIERGGIMTHNYPGQKVQICTKKGIVYGHRASVCLETQKYPDTPNKPEWPSALLKPGEKYDSHCIYRFSVKK